MFRMVASLCAGLLLQLVCAEEVTSPVSSSAEGTKQCLMQQKRQVSRSDAVSDNVHSDAVFQSDAISGYVGALQQISNMRLAGESHAKVESSASKHHHHKHLHHKDEKHGPEGNQLPPKLVLRKLMAMANKPITIGKPAFGNSHHKKHRKGHHKKGHHKSSKKGSEEPSLAQMSVSRGPWKEQDVPEHIFALGMKLFKTKDAVMGCVENSVVVDVTHAGVAMSLRMNKFDDATTRLSTEGTLMSYDLDTMGSNSDEILNMIDIGGNYGVVTIAAMKKYASNLRVVTVEPIPTTYFFLRWNLHINGISEIEQADWNPTKGTPGVLALNSGSADKPGENLHFCSYPWASMNSKMCDCKEGEDNCIIVPSITVDDLAAQFGSQPISMVKMDCEGCEFQVLPAFAKSDISRRVHRLAGELHIPDKKLEELACRWDHGRLMSKCQFSPKNPKDVECDVKLACPT